MSKADPEKLAAALRANLWRRKGQVSRGEGEPNEPVKPPPPSDLTDRQGPC